MKISIDSSKVPAYSLCIFKDDDKIHEDLHYSRNKMELDIGNVSGVDIRFVWSFALDKKEKKTLREKLECPPWNLHAKEPVRLTKSFFDFMFGKQYPNPADGSYFTKVANIPADLECLHLAFRGTSLYKGFALLDVNSEFEDKLVDVSFVRKGNLEEIKAKSNQRKYTYLCFRIVEILILTCVGVALEEYYPNMFLIFMLVGFYLNEIKDTTRGVKHIKGFFLKCKEVKIFKEPSAEEIIVLDSSDDGSI